MNWAVKELAETVAPCGLICGLCLNFQNTKGGCKGCKQSEKEEAAFLCDYNCTQRRCWKKNGNEGCWECETPCNQGIGAGTKQTARMKAFLQCAREEGAEKLAEYVLANEARGIRYHREGADYAGDYDNCGDSEEVLRLLRTGRPE